MNNVRNLLLRTQQHAADFLEGLETKSVAATVSAADVRKRLHIPLENNGVDAERVIDELVSATDGAHLGSGSGRFFAWVIGGALPSSLAADWLVSTWDNNAALYACGPAAAVCEEVAAEWIKGLLGLPHSASYAFTTGCQMAHVTCLAAARNSVLRAYDWDVEREGLSGAPRIRVLTNEHRHGSIERALRMLGIGSGAVVPLAAMNDGRIATETLRSALRAESAPTIVVLDAGDLNIGAIDSFAELVPVAHEYNAWVHVDGAFGLWARASAMHCAKLDGIEHADSWATDAHKWLNTPKDIGLAFVRDTVSHKNAMRINASYLSSDTDVRDQIDWTPDWTRRARGFPVYAALRELGRSGVAQLIDASCEHALKLCERISSLPGAELVAKPTLNQALVRFLHPSTTANDCDHDIRTDQVIAAINNEGTAFFSGTTWRGRRAMRISEVNWRTTSADVDRTVDAIERVLNAC